MILEERGAKPPGISCLYEKKSKKGFNFRTLARV